MGWRLWCTEVDEGIQVDIKKRKDRRATPHKWYCSNIWDCWYEKSAWRSLQECCSKVLRMPKRTVTSGYRKNQGSLAIFSNYVFKASLSLGKKNFPWKAPYLMLSKVERPHKEFQGATLDWVVGCLHKPS